MNKYQRKSVKNPQKTVDNFDFNIKVSLKESNLNNLFNLILRKTVKRLNFKFINFILNETQMTSTLFAINI